MGNSHRRRADKRAMPFRSSSSLHGFFTAHRFRWLALGLGVVAMVAIGCGASRPSRPARALNDEGARAFADGDLEHAEASLRLALEFDPSLASARANLGLVALGRGDLDAAERELRHAVQLREDFVEAWSDLGVVLERRGRDDEARAAFERALSIHPGRPEPRLALARLLVRHGAVAEARAHLLRLEVLGPSDVEVLGLLAWCELRLGRPAAALALAERALSLDPAAPAASLTFAAIEARRALEGAAPGAELTGDASSALADALERLHALAAPEMDALVRRLAETRLATLFVAVGELDEAERRVRALLASEPDDAALRLVAGTIALRRGAFVEAEQQARRAVELDPSVGAWLLLAEACAARGDARSRDAALVAARAALDHDPALDRELVSREVERIRHASR